MNAEPTNFCHHRLKPPVLCCEQGSFLHNSPPFIVLNMPLHCSYLPSPHPIVFSVPSLFCLLLATNVSPILQEATKLLGSSDEDEVAASGRTLSDQWPFACTCIYLRSIHTYMFLTLYHAYSYTHMGIGKEIQTFSPLTHRTLLSLIKPRGIAGHPISPEIQIHLFLFFSI